MTIRGTGGANTASVYPCRARSSRKCDNVVISIRDPYTSPFTSP